MTSCEKTFSSATMGIAWKLEILQGGEEFVTHSSARCLRCK